MRRRAINVQLARVTPGRSHGIRLGCQNAAELRGRWSERFLRSFPS
jgi:hypothetical protein